ncbi:DUF6789 family protein [Vulgatibacter sp.]|uniref:DUF6789 family protein n=1 Tax=Vulgatibacter sp. TaxID=1971226 RepID=UPI00356A12D8
MAAERASDAARGAAAGLLGTAALSATITAGRLTGAVPLSPPREISFRLQQHFPKAPHLAVWGLGHFAYGAFFGAAFAAGRPSLPAPAPLAGVLYGLGLWAASYVWLMPRLGLYPKPSWDKPSRRHTMIVGHALYGLVLGLLDARRR